jgi:hypothetical protein
MTTHIEADKGTDAGDCDIDDNDCRTNAVAQVSKPSDDTKLMISERLDALEKKVEEL